MTINSTRDVIFSCNALLATTVKFLVSVHLALCIVNIVVTDLDVFEVGKVSDTNSCVLLNHDTSDKGLLEIVRVNTTLSVSFTIITSRSSIDGLSVGKMKVWFYYHFSNSVTPRFSEQAKILKRIFQYRYRLDLQTQ